MPLPAATSRIDVTINSLVRISIRTIAFVKPTCTKQASAAVTIILSANGSANFPKSVIRSFFRAIFPSRWSVYEAAPKIIAAIM